MIQKHSPPPAKARMPREDSGHCSPWAVGEGTFPLPQVGQSGRGVGRRCISQGWEQGWGFLEGLGPAEQPFLCWRKTSVAHYKAGFGVGPGPSISPSLGWNPQFDEPPEKDLRGRQLSNLPPSEISHSLDPRRPPAAWSIQAGWDGSWRRLPLVDSEPGRADRVGWGQVPSTPWLSPPAVTCPSALKRELVSVPRKSLLRAQVYQAQAGGLCQEAHAAPGFCVLPPSQAF